LINTCKTSSFYGDQGQKFYVDHIHDFFDDIVDTRVFGGHGNAEDRKTGIDAWTNHKDGSSLSHQIKGTCNFIQSEGGFLVKAALSPDSRCDLYVFSCVVNKRILILRNIKKELVWDEKSNKNPIILECYTPKTKNLKPEWIYKSGDLTSKILEEFLDVDNEIVAAHIKNDPGKIALNTVFHSNFKLKEFNNFNSLIRVDYLIEDASFNDLNPQLNDFKWQSGTQKGKSQECLKEAIRNTLQDPSINPKGKVIYTYYLKFENKSESKK
jgi:hypothetical protein